MAYSNIDRTEEVESCRTEIMVMSTDYCRYFARHPDTLLQRKECWTCKYGNFGIEEGDPAETGICRYRLTKNDNQFHGRLN